MDWSSCLESVIMGWYTVSTRNAYINFFVYRLIKDSSSQRILGIIQKEFYQNAAILVKHAIIMSCNVKVAWMGSIDGAQCFS